MEWIQLSTNDQLEQIINLSNEKPQVIFKHSTRCSISAVAWKRVQKNHEKTEVNFYFLDLIAYRSLSNKIAEIFNVYHESPQVLVIKNGQCVFDESHLSISLDEILEQANAA